MSINAIFSNPAFQMESLTASILKIPFVPTQARSSGIFTNEGIETTFIDLEYDSVGMVLIPNRQRGDDPYEMKDTKRTVRQLKPAHLLTRSTIKPSQFQNVREFGGRGLKTIQTVIDKQLRQMTLSHDLTLEYQSIGAIKGIIYDSDGSTVLYNLFTEFGISQTVIDFVLGDVNQDMKHRILQVKRQIQKATGGLVPSGISCFSGDDWFDSFVSHPDVKEAFRLWQANNSRRPSIGTYVGSPKGPGQFGDFLRDDNRDGFEFAGVMFYNYINPALLNFVAPGEAYFFPVGIPNLFMTNFAPPDMIEFTNTEGLPRYARAEPLRMGRGIEMQVESDPLAYCSRPECLVKGITSTYPDGIPN